MTRVEYIQTQIVVNLNMSSTVELTVHDIFYNIFSIRLTTNGKNKFVKLYDNWTFEVDSKLKSWQLTDLFRKMIYPYYLDNSKLILFSEEDAFMVKLAGMDTWLLGKQNQIRATNIIWISHFSH